MDIVHIYDNLSWLSVSPGGTVLRHPFINARMDMVPIYDNLSKTSGPLAALSSVTLASLLILPTVFNFLLWNSDNRQSI